MATALGPDDIVLRDGAMLTVRPVVAGDEPALRTFLEGLSERSRWFRFFSGAADMRTAARWAADVAAGERAGLVATAGPDHAIIAHAGYSRASADRAEIAFAVADAYQGRGIATLMLRRLAEAAQRDGIATFVAVVLPSNHQMIAVFRESGFPVRMRSAAGELIVELPTSLTDEARERFEQRERIAAAAAVATVLEPRSLVLVGASAKRGSIGAAILGNLREAHFAGKLYAVNTRGGDLGGLRVHRSVADLPEAPELAVIAIPAAGVTDVARQCAQKGVRALVVISAGFAEAGSEGVARQDELVEICRESGMRLVGPNCLGVLNTAEEERLNATFAPRAPKPGRAAILSQSGGVGIAVIEHADALGLGLSSFASVGNKADLSGNDFLQYWEQDEATGVVLLYLESLGNPRKFARVARRVGASKPVLAVKAGRSTVGARAAGSHTGALLASSDTTVDALFTQAGVIRADTLEELLDVAALLSEQPLPASRRVAVLSNAGGMAILCADACAAYDLELPTLSADTQGALASFLPDEASTANPVDMIASASAEDYARALGVLSEDPSIDAVLALFVPPLVTRADDVAAALARAWEDGGRRIPLVASFATGEPPPGALREVGIPAYPFPEDAAQALGRAAAYAAWRTHPQGEIPRFDVREEEAAAVIAEALAEGGGWLDPARAGALCDCYGIPLAPARAAATPEAAGAAADELGGTVALKAVAPGLVHKTEAGGVQLGLQGARSVTAAARRMERDVERAGHGPVGFLVQREVTGGTEMLVGVTQDATFGPVLACGAGGTAAELLRDVSVRITPITDVDAHEMVRSLRTFPLLDGYRGAPPDDVPALERLLLRVSALVEAHPEVAEFECNPVLVTPDGATAVDVRVRVAPGPSAPRESEAHRHAA